MRISDWSSDVCSSDLSPACGVHDDEPWQPSREPLVDVQTPCRGRWRKRRRNQGVLRGVSLRVRYDGGVLSPDDRHGFRSEEHTSELQSLMRISYAVFCWKQKTDNNKY